MRRDILTLISGLLAVWLALACHAQQAELVVQMQTYGIQTVAFSTDGRLLATTGLGAVGEVGLWDVATGLKLNVLRGHSRVVTALAFTPDGKRLMTAGDDGLVLIWNAASATIIGSVREPLGIRQAALSPDGNTLGIIKMDNSVELWDANSFQPRQPFFPPRIEDTSCLTFSADSKQLACGGIIPFGSNASQHISIYNLETGGRSDFDPISESIIHLAFSPDGKTLACGTNKAINGRGLLEKCRLTLWDTQTRKPDKLLDDSLVGLTHIEIGHDGTILAGTETGTVRLWNADGKVRSNYVGKGGAFSGDARTLATTLPDRVQLWDLKSGRQLRSLTGQAGFPNQAAFSPDGRTLRTGRHEWDVRTGEQTNSLTAPAAEGITRLVLSPDGKLLISDCPDSTLRLWDAATGRQRGVLSGNLNRAGAITYGLLCTPTSDRVATFSVAGGQSAIDVWDVATRQVVHTLAADTLSSEDNGMAFSPDGRYVAVGASDPRDLLHHPIEIRDLNTGEVRQILSGHENEVAATAFSANGAVLASQDRTGVIKLWDVVSGKEITPAQSDMTKAAYPHVYHLCFARNDTILISLEADRAANENEIDDGLTGTGGYDRVIQWDVRSGKQLQTLQNGVMAGERVIYSPDGGLRVRQRSGGPIRLERLTDPQNVRALAPETAAMQRLAFSHDGRLLIGWTNARGLRVIVLPEGRMLRLSGGSFVLLGVADAVGKRIAKYDRNRPIQVWDALRGIRLYTLGKDLEESDWVVFSPDGKTLASSHRLVHRPSAPPGKPQDGSGAKRGLPQQSASETEIVQLWDAGTGRPLQRLVCAEGSESELYASGAQIIFSGNGAKVACIGKGNSVVIWETATGKKLTTLPGAAEAVDSLTFSNNGGTLAMSRSSFFLGFSPDNTIKIVAKPTNQTVQILTGHESGVNALAFGPITPDGVTLLASGGKDDTVRLWNPTINQATRVWRQNAPVTSVVFSWDNTRVASGSLTGEVKIWEIAGDKSVRTLPGTAHPVSALAFNPFGTLLAVGTNDGGVIVYDLASGKAVRTLPPLGSADPRDRDREFTGIDALVFSPQGDMLAVGGLNETRVWAVANWQERATFTDTATFPNGTVSRLQFLGDGRTLAVGSMDGRVRYWDIMTRNKIQEYAWYPCRPGMTAFPQGDSFMAVGDLFIGRFARLEHGIRLWSADTGKLLRTIDGPPHRIGSLAFSSDGALLAGGSSSIIGGAAADIFLWDTLTGEEKARLHGHGADVIALGFQPGGDLLASSSTDGTTKLWRIDAKRPAASRQLATLITVGQDDYMTVLPDNYYRATHGALGGVAFHIGDHAYPFEQFDVRYNRPDIVLERLPNAPAQLKRAVAQAVSKRLSFLPAADAKPIAGSQLPELALTGPEPPLAWSERRFAFTLHASDNNATLTRLMVFVNDVPCNGVVTRHGAAKEPFAGAAGYVCTGGSVHTLDAEVAIDLSRGENKIQVAVLNSQGLESLKQTFRIVYDPPGKPTGSDLPDLYMVAIGVSVYRDGNHNLDYADKDADAMIAFFQQHRDQYANVHVLALTNANATKDNIMRKTRDMLAQTKIDDTVILFLAGHGIIDAKLDYYFGAYDIDFDHDPAHSGLSYREIEGLLDGIEARKKLLLMDTCHAGEMDSSEWQRVPRPVGVQVRDGLKRRESATGLAFKPQVGLANSFALMQELFADLRRGSGAQVIAAASGPQVAIESSGHGVFTQALLDGLEQGIRKVGDLKEYVYTRVKELTHGQQTPTMRYEDLEFDFELY